jgi:hypothetical protein
MDITVVGIFDSRSLAEEARRALLAVGVLEARIVLDQREDGVCSVGVHAQSSLERDRIRDLLQRNGASRTEQRRGLRRQPPRP